jgi:hypothetical protein
MQTIGTRIAQIEMSICLTMDHHDMWVCAYINTQQDLVGFVLHNYSPSRWGVARLLSVENTGKVGDNKITRLTPDDVDAFFVLPPRPPKYTTTYVTQGALPLCRNFKVVLCKEYCRHTIVSSVNLYVFEASVWIFFLVCMAGKFV